MQNVEELRLEKNTLYTFKMGEVCGNVRSVMFDKQLGMYCYTEKNTPFKTIPIKHIENSTVYFIDAYRILYKEDLDIYIFHLGEDVEYKRKEKHIYHMLSAGTPFKTIIDFLIMFVE